MGAGDSGALDPILVPAMPMLDLLVAIKMDLTMLANAVTAGAEDLQTRIDRACATINTAIGELKQAGVAPGNRKGNVKASDRSHEEEL